MWKIVLADIRYYKIFIFMLLFVFVIVLSYAIEVPVLSEYLRQPKAQSMLLGATFSFTFLVPPIKFLFLNDKWFRTKLLPISRFQKISLVLFAILFGPIFTSVFILIASFFIEISFEKFLIFLEAL